MNLRLLFCSFCLSLSIGAAAQNNPYSIDDDCYRIYVRSEKLAGKEGFEECNLQLLNLALEKKDKKAETLYYVEEMKNWIRRPACEHNDSLVDLSFARLKEAAERNGYKQYYYYGYQLAEEYYKASDRFYRSLELAKEAQDRALKEHDDYGIWTSYKFLASIYINQNDYVSAKKYILTALRIFNTTNDKAVRRQSPTRLYCDLSDTYPVGDDSVTVCLANAGQWAKEHMDTLRCRYYQARRAIVDANIDTYKRYRDYCLADSAITRISPSAREFFRLADAVTTGQIEGHQEDILKLSTIREMKVLANACERYGYTAFAFDLEKRLVRYLEDKVSADNQAKFSELDAQMGNAVVRAELAGKEEQLSQVSHMLLVVLLVLFIAMALAALIYIRILQKNKHKDKERIEELKRANEKVRLADEAKTRFVQNMSHEVRTPLNAIVGFSQLLGLPDGTLSPEEKDEYAGIIVNNSNMLTMLLDDILNASAMDSGTYKITYYKAECRSLCSAAMGSVEYRVQPGVILDMEADFEGEHEVRTDPLRVQQILINLLTNACKHTSQGSIKLRCSLSDTPGMVTFSVTDTGPGVPEEKAEEIFNRFTKLNEFVQGTGLGLSICRDIASRMDGSVYLDTSYKEGGARFIFTIPDTPWTENNS